MLMFRMHLQIRRGKTWSAWPAVKWSRSRHQRDLDVLYECTLKNCAHFGEPPWNRDQMASALACMCLRCGLSHWVVLLRPGVVMLYGLQVAPQVLMTGARGSSGTCACLGARWGGPGCSAQTRTGTGPDPSACPPWWWTCRLGDTAWHSPPQDTQSMLLRTDIVSNEAAPDEASPLTGLAVGQSFLPGPDACHHDDAHVIQHALHSTSPCMLKSQQHFHVQRGVLCSALGLTLHTQRWWQSGHARCTLLAHAQIEVSGNDCHTPSPGCRPSLCARCGSRAGTPARGRGPPGPPSARGAPAAAARPPSCASAAHTLCIRRTACGHLCSCTTSQQTAWSERLECRNWDYEPCASALQHVLVWVLASYRASVCRTFGIFKRDASCWAREDLPASWHQDQSDL